MAYRVVLHRNAEKQYKRQSNNVKSCLNKVIEDFRTREDPRKGTHVRKLKGRLQGKYRYRVGGLRIIYEVYDEEKLIRIAAIGSRGDIY